METAAVICVATVALAGLIFATFVVKELMRQVSEAQRILASRDYADFARGTVIESKAREPRPPTDAEVDERAEALIYERSFNSPGSVG